MPSELTVRPATVEDADALAELFWAAREASYPAIPRPVHAFDSVRAWLRGRVEAAADPATEVWLAEEGAAVLGLLLVEQDWLHSLYVAPGRTGEGVGSVLLEVARSLRPDGLGLWVFETNHGARRFYERHGFVEVRRTDGTGPDGNEEQQPDLELRWPDPGSLQALRRRIDGVDDRLAALLGERARLTAAVQAVKAVPGHAGRDPEREREIAERMARVAPELGPERLARIMHRVITESLDAAAGEGVRDGAAEGPGEP